MGDAFRWNQWNLDHVTKHGCTAAEAERVVLAKAPGRKIGNDKFLVEGRGQGGRRIRVIYLIDDDDGRFYVIHAQPLR